MVGTSMPDVADNIDDLGCRWDALGHKSGTLRCCVASCALHQQGGFSLLEICNPSPMLIMGVCAARLDGLPWNMELRWNGRSGPTICNRRSRVVQPSSSAQYDCCATRG
ncbi:unnamed protein product [Ostreobium quekettii]|uniref:Uncharacterized protein n=1 Tax=Ostreobium quekettii TaxID=121088 RepID=A0A8S1JA09_9CHLO|nr:unnamed protein product [Ostreobium quekettii]